MVEKIGKYSTNRHNMSRPKPTILREYIDDVTHRYEQILAAEAVWAQLYKEKPFNLKILKQDVDKYLKSDDELIKLEQKVTYVQSVVDYLDRTVKIISNRGFQIKNAIDWRKFTSGVI